ncbi:SRPBCC domain-containing protein [Nocardia sp. NPDC056611]|uniref:SRPBCC family protein n=1 Tax=Nocardia sp. NPDC056611 TaxID=3345877 RepID=UPI0036734608
MTDQNFTTSITVDRTPAEVFAAVLNARGWWSPGIKGGTERAGDRFVFEAPGVHRSEIELTEVVPDERVVWLVKDNFMSFIEDQTEWVNTEMRFDIAATDGGTELTFTHVGLVPDYECYDACSPAWTFYITESLRDLVTTGVGQPSEFPGQVEAEAAAAAAAQN